jgi:hypothetical protein
LLIDEWPIAVACAGQLTPSCYRIFGFLEHLCKTRFRVPKITLCGTPDSPAPNNTSLLRATGVPKISEFAPHGYSSKNQQSDSRFSGQRQERSAHADDCQRPALTTSLNMSICTDTVLVVPQAEFNDYFWPATEVSDARRGTGSRQIICFRMQAEAVRL